MENEKNKRSIVKCKKCKKKILNPTSRQVFCSSKISNCKAKYQQKRLKEKRRVDRENRVIKFHRICAYRNCNNQIHTNVSREIYCKREHNLKEASLQNKEATIRKRELEIIAKQKAIEDKARQDILDKRLKIIPRSELRKIRNTKATRAKAKKVLENKGDYSCNSRTCKNRTWKSNGYCSDCQAKGKKIAIPSREYSTGIYNIG